MAGDLAKALFQSRTRAALLETVLRDDVSDSLSGLARRVGLSQHTVAVEVRNLAAAGLVNVESVGGADLVRANRAHPAVGLLVQLLTLAHAGNSPSDDSDHEVMESLAHFGAPLGARKARQHLTLEVTLVRALGLARRAPSLLEVLPVVIVKHRKRLSWPTLKEEARRLKLKAELVMVVELAADASGFTGLTAHVAELRDHRRKSAVFPLHIADDALRARIRRNLPRSERLSNAAQMADASERERIRRMSLGDRVLLALDLGERLNGFARPPA